MRVKGLLVLLAVLVVLAGVFVAERMEEHPGAPFHAQLVSLDPATVARIEIEGPKGRTVLERRPDGWRVTAPVDYPADQSLVTSTLSLLTNLSSNALISTNPKRAAVFEVDPDHAVKVSLYAADEADPRVRLMVGKLTPGFTNTYVALAGSPEVHQVAGALRFQLERDGTAWRDKTVLSFDPARVVRVALKGKDAVAVVRGEEGWNWAPDAPAPATGDVDGAAVERLVKQLSVLKAHGFDDHPPEPPAEPLLTVTLSREDGANPIDLVVEAEDSGRYRVVAEANPQRFLIPKGILADFVEDPRQALVKKAAPPEPVPAAPASAPADATPEPVPAPAPAPKPKAP